MNDFSFIRLVPDFANAKIESVPSMADIGYFDQIQLHPKETYLQITNTVDGIAFDGNFVVEIIDCKGKILKDITTNVAISEFTDNNGLPQIALEIAYINEDFFCRNVFLKFTHTVSDYVWYSNPILITDYRINETTRFDYRGFADFHGIAYNNADFMQSIRLRCNFTLNDSESISGSYTSIDGMKVTSRLIETEFEKYNFERIDNFTFRRLNKLLSHQVIYINGNRVTDKQTTKSTELLGDTNVFSIDFKVAINYRESFTSAFQIHQNFALIDYLPVGNNSLASLGNDITGVFNRPFYSLQGSIELIDNSDDSIIYSFMPSEINISMLNFFTADITSLITVNGSYKIKMSDSLFVSSFGELFPFFEWNFTVENAHYNPLNYNNSQYFTS